MGFSGYEGFLTKTKDGRKESIDILTLLRICAMCMIAPLFAKFPPSAHYIL